MAVIECKKAGSGFKNTGAKEQSFFGQMVRTAVAIPGFSFASATEAKSLTAWQTAIAEKKIFPLYEVEELASENVAPTGFEGRSQFYEATSGKKKLKYNSMVGICSYADLKSFEKSTMQLFEFTEDGAIKGVDDAGKIVGQTVVINVGMFMDPIGDKPSFAEIKLSYKDRNQFEDSPAVLRPTTWDWMDIYGIFDVKLISVSESATELKVKIIDAGCCGDPVKVFTLSNLEIRNASNAVHAFTSFIGADADGVVTFIGTGFGNGFTVNLKGVVTVSGMSYESTGALTLSDI